MKRLATCHAERKHYSRGLCAACYNRQWAAAHPEKRRAARLTNYCTHVEARKAYSRAWYARNKSRALAAAAEWQRANPEKVKIRNAKWEAANPEKRRAAGRRRHQADPQKCVVKGRARRARLHGVAGAGVSQAQWQDVLEVFGYTCAYCLRIHAKLTQDHIVPLCRGGAHAVDNVVPACKGCNSAKGPKSLLGFLQAQDEGAKS